MYIKFWGARGSIPVSGPEFCKFGGDTTCVELRSEEGDVVVIDAGTGIRRLGDKLQKERTFEINWLFTHSHLDHVIGFPFFLPLFTAQTSVNIYAYPKIQGNMFQQLAYLMHPPHFPVTLDKLQAEINYREVTQNTLSLNSLYIQAISLSHPNNALGFRFREGERTMVLITDNELGYRHRGGKSLQTYIDFCAGSDILIHDAEYTEEEYGETYTWGHSTYKQALNLALQAKVGQLGFFHHNRNRSDLELEKKVENCNRYLREKREALTCFAVTQEQEIVLG